MNTITPMIRSVLLFHDWIRIQPETDVFEHDIECPGEPCVYCNTIRMIKELIAEIDSASTHIMSATSNSCIYCGESLAVAVDPCDARLLQYLTYEGLRETDAHQLIDRFENVRKQYVE